MACGVDPARLMSSLMTGYFFHSVKQVFPSFKVCLQRIDKHGLAESAWAAQVVVLFAAIYQFPYYVALVNIEIIVFSDFLERLNAYW